jgi:hypothetical protein
MANILRSVLTANNFNRFNKIALIPKRNCIYIKIIELLIN